MTGFMPHKTRLVRRVKRHVSEKNKKIATVAATAELDAEDPEGELALLSTLADPESVNPEERLIQADNVARLRRAIARALRRLSHRERAIAQAALRLSGRPLSEVAEQVGVSRQRVAQVMDRVREEALGRPRERKGPGRQHWREDG